MSIIEAVELGVGFGAKSVLNKLSLGVPEGTICALLGPNGVGKTTLVKTLVNILKPKQGRSAILGVPSSKLSPKEFQRIGYVSENQELPLWMKLDEFLHYCSSLYPQWDHSWCNRKVKEYGLSPKMRLREMSRGTRVKASLLSSFSYHPEVLILDEPFMGLDPIARDDLLDLVIALTAENNSTALICSHDLSEVERISDSVAFLLQGKISVHATLDELLQRFRVITIELPEANHEKLTSISDWYAMEKKGSLLRFVDAKFSQESIEHQLRSLAPEVELKEVQTMDLREIYRVLVSVCPQYWTDTKSGEGQ